MAVLAVRELLVGDLDVVHAINQAAVPAVGDATPAHLRQLWEWSASALVAERDGAVVAFVLAMRPGVPYASPNFRWFSRAYADFVYVDRIAVAPAASGSGIGRRLYEAVMTAHADAGRIACEVNVRPMNASSLSFHAALGFAPVAEQETYDGTVRVRLLTRSLP